MEEWIAKGEDNYFDPAVMSYPVTTPLALRSKSKTIMYVPVQKVFMMESLAINPEATNHEIAVALRELIVTVAYQSQQLGQGELYFMGTNEKTNEFALKHGLEELPWKAYRMRAFEVGDINENLSKISARPLIVPSS